MMGVTIFVVGTFCGFHFFINCVIQKRGKCSMFEESIIGYERIHKRRACLVILQTFTVHLLNIYKWTISDHVEE